MPGDVPRRMSFRSMSGDTPPVNLLRATPPLDPEIQDG